MSLPLSVAKAPHAFPLPEPTPADPASGRVGLPASTIDAANDAGPVTDSATTERHGRDPGDASATETPSNRAVAAIDAALAKTPSALRSPLAPAMPSTFAASSSAVAGVDLAADTDVRPGDSAEPVVKVQVKTRDKALAVKLRALLAQTPCTTYDPDFPRDEAPARDAGPSDDAAQTDDAEPHRAAPDVFHPDIQILCHGDGDADPLLAPIAIVSDQETELPPPFIVVGTKSDTALDKLALQRGAADYLVADDLSPEMLDRALRYAMQRHEAAGAMTKLAMYDELTGLYNRSMFQELLRHAVHRARREQRRLSLMFIDLDRFKTVNDTLGHAFGDRLLAEVGNRLRQCLRATDLICRLGGDEFTVILEGARSSADTTTVARKILDSLSAPFVLSGKETFISASIGIAEAPDGSEASVDGDGYSDADTLIANADLAMYRAKNRGRACFTFFTPEFSRVARRKSAIEDLLRAALDKGGLDLSYQPQIDLESETVIGFESLVRLNDKAFGPLLPGEFIPIAEESGLIHRLGAWVVEEACRQGAVWDKGALGDFRLSVNLSARQFQRNDVITTVGRALARSGFPANRLDLELTESHLAADPDAAASALARLRRMGIGVAVDDFGTGYSSLLMLKRLPVSWLKIDRSFVAGLPDREEDKAIAEAVIGLAHSLELKVIAEGVETPAQLASLRAMGCDAAQGYLFSPPMRADQVPGWMRTWRHDVGCEQAAV